MAAKPPTERDFVLLPLAEKNRPAIVLEILASDMARVIYGTGTARDVPRVEVRPESREGKGGPSLLLRPLQHARTSCAGSFARHET
jgi:hypothetical protein